MSVQNIVNNTWQNGYDYGERMYGLNAFNTGYQNAVDNNNNAYSLSLAPFGDKNDLIATSEEAGFQEKYEAALQNQERTFYRGVNNSYADYYNTGFNGVKPSIVATLTNVKKNDTRYDPASTARAVSVDITTTGWYLYDEEYTGNPQNVTVTITIDNYVESRISGQLVCGTKYDKIGRYIEPPSTTITIASMGTKTYTFNVTTNANSSHNLYSVYAVLDSTNSTHMLFKYIIDTVGKNSASTKGFIIDYADGYNGERLFIGSVNEVSSYDLSYNFSFNVTTQEENSDYNLMTTTSGKINKYPLSEFSSTYTKTLTGVTSLTTHWSSIKSSIKSYANEFWQFIASLVTAPNGTGEVGETWDMSDKFKVVSKRNI